MSIDRPRRLFRSTPRSSYGLNRTVVASLLGAVGGIILMGLSEGSPGIGASATVITAAANQVAVIDGDTLRLAGQVIRLSDVSAPLPGQTCAAGPDCGARASAILAGLVHDRPVECRVAGQDGQGHATARCAANGVDINGAMVWSGWVRAMAPGLRPAEDAARSAHRGLWHAD